VVGAEHHAFVAEENLEANAWDGVKGVEEFEN
jgi:hypothetical protein